MKEQTFIMLRLQLVIFLSLNVFEYMLSARKFELVSDCYHVNLDMHVFKVTLVHRMIVKLCDCVRKFRLIEFIVCTSEDLLKPVTYTFLFVGMYGFCGVIDSTNELTNGSGVKLVIK